MAHSEALLVLENFIAGRFVPCSSYIDSYNPSTGDVYCRVPDSGKEEVSTIQVHEEVKMWNACCEWERLEGKRSEKLIKTFKTKMSKVLIML